MFYLDKVNPAQTKYAQTQMLTNCHVKTPEQTHAWSVEMLFTDPRWIYIKNKQ